MISQPRSSGPAVVLQVRSGAPSRTALQAAIEVARAMHSELHSVFVEDAELMSLAGLPCAREVSLGGRHSRGVSLPRIEEEMRLAFSAVRRQLEAMAASAAIPCRCGTVRDELETAIAGACPEGALVALSEIVGPSDLPRLERLMQQCRELSGFVLVGPHARLRQGPIVVAVEEVGRIAPLLEVARRLRSAAHDQILLVLVGDDQAELDMMQIEARRSPVSDLPVTLASTLAVEGTPAVIAEAVRRLQGGFVIGHMGGLLTPARSELRHLTLALECPLLLLR